MPGDTRNKRVSKLDREMALDETGKLHRRGYSVASIAKLLGVSATQVYKDLKIIKHRCTASIVDNREAMINEKKQQYREVLNEAWQQWEKSKEDAQKKVEKFVLPYKKKQEQGEEVTEEEEQELKRIQETITTEGRLAEVAFLQIVTDCLKAERELLGLDEPRRVDVGGASHQFHWDMLQAVPTTEEPKTRVDKKIKKLLEDCSAFPPAAKDMTQAEIEELSEAQLEDIPPSTNGVHQGDDNDP